MPEDNPYWWWPVVIDDEYIKFLRTLHIDETNISDYELIDLYNSGKKHGDYSTMWDNLGDAYTDYKRLADAFLSLVEEKGISQEHFG